MVYDRSSSKNIYLNVAVNTLKKLRSKSTPTSPALSASNTHTQISTPVILLFLLYFFIFSRHSSKVAEGKSGVKCLSQENDSSYCLFFGSPLDH